MATSSGLSSPRAANDVLKFRIEFTDPITVDDETVVDVQIDVDGDTTTDVDPLERHEYVLNWHGYGSVFYGFDSEEVKETKPESLEFDHAGASVTFTIAATDIGSPVRFAFCAVVDQEGQSDGRCGTYPNDDIATTSSYPTETYDDETTNGAVLYALKFRVGPLLATACDRRLHRDERTEASETRA